MLAGRPNDETFLPACERLHRLMREKGDKLMVHPKYTCHIRGDFPAINVGVTHGKGSCQPHPVKHSLRVQDIVYGILEDPDMKRVAGFQDCAFRTWAPKLYGYYRSCIDRLWANEELVKEQKLRRNFAEGIFPSIALNFGPRVWTIRHRDTRNLPFGWCAITALGDFDPEKGGHLVLPDLRLVIEFPPGSTILIPSATLVHANVPVREGESRLSFTQFCAGDIFRFVECGFRTEARLKQDDPDEYKRVMKLKHDRWTNGLELWSKFNELPLDHITTRYGYD